MTTKIAQLSARPGTGAHPTFAPADFDRTNLTNMPAKFTETQLSALSRLKSININFVKLKNCDRDPQFCKQWTAAIPLASFSSPNAMSCRFYRLLDSNSLGFKQTIYVEWHDDRLVPWLHYVPVSTSYEELPILIDLFSKGPRGQELGSSLPRPAEIGRALRSTRSTFPYTHIAKCSSWPTLSGGNRVQPCS